MQYLTKRVSTANKNICIKYLACFKFYLKTEDNLKINYIECWLHLSMEIFLILGIDL